MINNFIFSFECHCLDPFVYSSRSDLSEPAAGADPMPAAAPEGEAAPGDVSPEDVEAAVAEAEDNMLE